MMNHDIFISYSSKQKSIADGICHYLEENGFRCWMAPRDIPVGSEYGDLIEEAIKTSKVVVLVFSEAASISKWVKGEINVAFTEDKPILPFRVDETEVKGGFRVMLNMMHWIDAFPHYADRLPDLLSSICGLLGRQARKVNVQNGTTNISNEKSNQSKIGTNIINGHEYVDLGLPSGTLWATCNVGANAPQEYGDYFAWGEIRLKHRYDWDNYKHCYKSNEGKNVLIDYPDTLRACDDAATASWGSGWCMPTEAQWKELLRNTTNIWTMQNGAHGRLFRSFSGNTLFLPAAGYNRFGYVTCGDNYGFYWSSSLDADLRYSAWYFDFGLDLCHMSRNDRSFGQSVRAVCAMRQN